MLQTDYPTVDLDFSDFAHIEQPDFALVDPAKPSTDPAIYLSPALDDISLYRRMSTVSATSDASSHGTTGDKRLLTPEDSPLAEGSKRPRTTIHLDGPLSDDAPLSGQDDVSGMHRQSVQLPSINSTFDDYHRRMSLPTEVLARTQYQNHAHPLVARYPSASTSPQPSYTFPPVPEHDRPRLDTNVSSLDPHAYGSAYPATTPSGTYYGTTPLTPDPNPFNQSFNGTLRISGQDRRPSLAASISSDKEQPWSFPSNSDYPPPTMQLTPATHSPPSASRSPMGGHMVPPPGSLVERPPRKRGKLPKHVTDYLKEWLHLHSDHPYPSEEEKKQLCHTTGLSMSQVSNWMINARRRILAPAQRAASAAAAAAAAANPYNGRASSHTNALIAAGRRASMPTSSAADSMSLYHPVGGYGSSLGGNLSYAHHGYGSVDHATGRPLAHHAPRSAGYMDPSYGRLPYAQAPPSGPSPPHNGGPYMASGVPMSAPPSMSFSPNPNSYSNGPVYAQTPPPPATQTKFYNGGASSDAPTNGAGVSTPGSNYGTPQ